MDENAKIVETSKNKKRFKLPATILTLLSLTVSASASGTDSGSISTAITEIGKSLTGVIGYMSQTTSAIMTDNLWLLGMGFFVILFIAGFVMYLFRVGRR